MDFCVNTLLGTPSRTRHQQINIMVDEKQKSYLEVDPSNVINITKKDLNDAQKQLFDQAVDN